MKYEFTYSVQLVLVDLVESSVSFLAGTMTSISLTATLFTLHVLAVDSPRGFTI